MAYGYDTVFYVPDIQQPDFRENESLAAAIQQNEDHRKQMCRCTIWYSPSSNKYYDIGSTKILRVMYVDTGLGYEDDKVIQYKDKYIFVDPTTGEHVYVLKDDQEMRKYLDVCESVGEYREV